MKKIFTFLFIVSSVTLYAQVTPKPSSSKKAIGRISPAVKAAGNTKVDPAINVNAVPVTENVPGSSSTNGTLNNLPVKTPIYNNQVTGTNAPGDMNTGLPANTGAPASTQLVVPINKYPSGNKETKSTVDSLKGDKP